MRIDKQLKLVIPVYDDDADPAAKPPKPATLRAVIHSEPISSDVFDTYFEPIAQVFTEIHAGRYTSISGPKIADKLLRKASVAMGIWESDPRSGRVGVRDGLLEEIHRLTNVLAPGKQGWRELLLQEAKDEILSRREAEEVDAMLVFFTVSSHMYPHQEVRAALDGAMSLRGARVEYSSFTELKASLPTLSAPENSGATAAGS